MRSHSAEIEARRLVESVPVACVLLDRELRFAFANSAYLELFGLTRDAIIGAYVFDVFSESAERVREATDHFERTLAGESISLDRHPYRIRSADGVLRSHYWRVSQQPFRACDQEITHVLQCVWDVTRETEIEMRNAAMSAELRHRVLNVFAVINAMVELCDRPGQSKDAYRNELTRRIVAMGRTHTALSDNHWRGLGLVDIFESEIAPFALDGSSNVSIKGPNVILTEKSSQDAAMIIHELTTNAAKYGCFSTPEGQLEIGIELDPAERVLTVIWSESGLTNIAPPEQSGFGTLLASLMPDLQVDREFRATGLKATFRVPLSIVSSGHSRHNIKGSH